MSAQVGTYERFLSPRPVKPYIGQPGNEPNRLRVPWPVLDSHAACLSRHLPQEYVAVGETTYPDGRRYLDFAATTAYIEAVTSYRWDAEAKRLRLRCPACGLWDGKHARGCTG